MFALLFEDKYLLTKARKPANQKAVYSGYLKTFLISRDLHLHYQLLRAPTWRRIAMKILFASYRVFPKIKF